MDWIQNGKLVGEQVWKDHAGILRKKVVPCTKEAVKQALLKAVISRIPQDSSKPFGVFLSGGVDSTLLAMICKQQKANFTCYSVGLQGCDDVINAQQTAKLLDLPLKTSMFQVGELPELFKKTAALYASHGVVPDVINVGIGAVIVAAAALAKKDGITVFLGGLGAEEIFAGYNRHLTAIDTNEECWRGLREMWSRDLVRDSILAEALGIAVLTPFLDDELIVAAMGIPDCQKINREHKKIILRQIAEELGMPKDIAWRKKQAAQYGTKFDWAMEKLAKNVEKTKSAFLLSL